MRTLILAGILLPFFSFAQVQGDSIQLMQEPDEMTGKVYTLPSKLLISANEDQTQGFILTPVINDEYVLIGVHSQIEGLGNCVEDVELIILFSDGTRMVKKSISDFNCEGEGIFVFYDNDRKDLANKHLSKIRITNNFNSKNYTGSVYDEYWNYFQQISYLLSNRIFVQK
jgi:hypothetical protein